jgi:hypothetical protein
LWDKGWPLAGMGAAIGLVAATGLMRLMKSLLFGISPLDPVTYAGVPLVLAAAAIVAVAAAEWLGCRPVGKGMALRQACQRRLATVGP